MFNSSSVLRLLLLAAIAIKAPLVGAADSTESLGANQASGFPTKPPAANGAAPTLPPQLAITPAEIRPQAPQQADYLKNTQSDTFGANLFTGAFARQGATQFNPWG